MQTNAWLSIRTLRLLTFSAVTTVGLVALLAIIRSNDADPAIVAPLSVQRDQMLYDNCRKDPRASCARELQRLEDAQADYAPTLQESKERRLVPFLVKLPDNE